MNNRNITERVIDAKGYRYMSEIPEFKQGLPHGILNKVIPDAGGTVAALNCEDNYIITVPFVPIIDSIRGDKNRKYDVHFQHHKVSIKELKEYLLTHDKHKIVVTYDSLPKVMDYITQHGFNLQDYKLLVDEYHITLNSLDFRANAIINMLKYSQKFNTVTFMSATVLKDEYRSEYMTQLPVTRIEWGRPFNRQVKKMPSTNPLYATKLMIEKFLRKELYVKPKGGEDVQVEELYIFINSVTGIKQILDSIEVGAGQTKRRLNNREVKVVCAEKQQNRSILGNYNISNVNDDNKPINFFTSLAFYGVNLFSNNGLMVVVSERYKLQTLVDLSTTLHQIVGRLRNNAEYNNVFKGVVFHIYSKFGKVEKDEDFITRMEERRLRTEAYVKVYETASAEHKRSLLEGFEEKSKELFCHYDEDEDRFIYCKDKENFMIHKHKELNHVYSNGVTLQRGYEEAGFEVGVGEKFKMRGEEVFMKTVMTSDYKKHLLHYFELRDNVKEPDSIEEYEMNYPEFVDAYEQLGRAGIDRCKYTQKRIKEMLKATSHTTTKYVQTEFYYKFCDREFISKREGKEFLQSLYNKADIKHYKPTLSVLNSCRWYDVVETHKRINGKLYDGIRLQKRPTDIFTPHLDKRRIERQLVLDVL